jgi:hypothetical protein
VSPSWARLEVGWGLSRRTGIAFAGMIPRWACSRHHIAETGRKT